jgi:hypothetical protein
MQNNSSGIVFPAGQGGDKPYEKRSTTAAAKRVLIAALNAANPADGEALAAQPAKQWRFGYQAHFVKVCAALARDKATMLKVARAGLQSAHATFRFHRAAGDAGGAQGTELSFREAMRQGTFTGSFSTGVCGAKNTNPDWQPDTIAVPYRGKEFRGDALLKLVAQWCDEGQAEPSFGASVEEVVRNAKTWLDLRGKVFVLIGATSEMGPTDALLRCGATIIALARPASKRDPEKWARLIARADRSPGTMLYPETDGEPGADALSQTPEIINWLCDLFTSHALCKGKVPHIYSGIYLDGGKFVRASLAMEAIISELTKRLPAPSLPALLYIDTPTSAHIIEPDTYEAQARLRTQAPCLLRAGAALGAFKPAPVHAEGTYVVADFLAAEQGPNYAIAKLLQKFRAVWSRHGEELLFQDGEGSGRRAKQLVSMTTGPAAKTDSVMHSPQMALVMSNLDGACAPNVAHDPETVQALMPLVLIRDLFSARALGNPANGKDGGNLGAMGFVAENSWHGGVWRSPFALKDVGISIYLRVYAVRYVLPLLGVMAVAAVWFAR